jgi:hypothetical protein
MVNDHETTARNAESTNSNDPGMCLQWSRQRAAIGSRYGDAATAWRNTINPHPGDRNPPRGAMTYWTGGGSGYGHIAPSVGGGKVRSTDSGGKGKPATVDLAWVERNWGLTYAGWAWDVNGVTIPHPDDTTGGGDDEMELSDDIGKWSPDDGSQGQTTVGKTLNQARGYAEDSYERIRTLQGDIEKIKQALGIK